MKKKKKLTTVAQRLKKVCSSKKIFLKSRCSYVTVLISVEPETKQTKVVKGSDSDWSFLTNHTASQDTAILGPCPKLTHTCKQLEVKENGAKTKHNNKKKTCQ